MTIEESGTGDPPIGSSPKGFIEEIPVNECFMLLQRKSVGRLAVVVADEPDVFTVNYVVDGTNVIFRTDYGLKLMQSVLQRIAFQVDDIDERRHEGWSVVLRGIGDEVSGDLADRTAAARDEILESWATGYRERWVRIVPRIVTGRRLVHR
jgi:nitroimidazol reductase NimA-like FMN-containing flavoprotein (pyridoxamine 5'-phosphate oxidase superfamily)